MPSAAATGATASARSPDRIVELEAARAQAPRPPPRRPARNACADRRTRACRPPCAKRDHRGPSCRRRRPPRHRRRAAEGGAAEPRLDAVDHGAHALRRLLRPRRRRACARRASRATAAAADDGSTARAARRVSSRSASICGGIGDARLGQRQRAGLVEHDRVDLGQPLDRIAGIEDQRRRGTARRTRPPARPEWRAPARRGR